jgi:hypothetical protein
MVVAINPAAEADVLNEYGINPPSKEDATLAILNAEGVVLSQWRLADLFDNDQLDPARLAVFLKVGRPQLPDAQQALDKALAEAKRDNKRVLIQLGGPGCGWCVVLSRFVDAHKNVFEQDYVYLKIDTRMPGADAVTGRLRPDPSGGVPWIAILDADGRTLATSDAEGGNIGYPTDEADRAHFEQMLRTTRQRLSDADLAGLFKALADNAAK